MSRCKATETGDPPDGVGTEPERSAGKEILRNEAYNKYAAVTKDEGNAADGGFPATSWRARSL